VAVDPTDPKGVWWWEPGRSGCSSRSTGPSAFRGDDATVLAGHAAPRDLVEFAVHERNESLEGAFVAFPPLEKGAR
jgi:hypothetical protein